MRGNYSVVCTSSAAVKNGPGGVYTVTLAGVSAAAKATLDDSIVASGTNLWTLSVVSGATTSISFGERALLFGTGIYVTLSGVGAQVSIQYE